MAVAWKHRLAVLGAMVIPGSVLAQVPDLLTAFDAGGRAFGSGGNVYATSADTLAALNNPAGLAYMTRRTFGLAARNLPNSQSRVFGEINDLRINSDSDSGDETISHLGLAIPVMRGGKQRGTLGLAWTVGGWFNDRQRGTNLEGGVASYSDFTRAKTDFVTLSYGQANSSQTVSVGLGVVFAQQAVRNLRRVTFTDSNIPPTVGDSDGTGSGVGFVGGLMVTPQNRSNLTFGLSVRTPISVSGDSEALDLYERIPGKLSASVALRQDGIRGGGDFLVYGAQADYFFGGKASSRLDREDHAAFGFGVEYNRVFGQALVPLRIGYRFVPAGGDGFGSRNSLTYGIGYRPNNADWTLDVNIGRPEGGGQDLSVYLTYRIGR